MALDASNSNSMEQLALKGLMVFFVHALVFVPFGDAMICVFVTVIV